MVIFRGIHVTGSRSNEWHILIMRRMRNPTWLCLLPLLLCVDIAARPDLDLPPARIPRAGQNPREIIVVHEIPIPCPAVLLGLLCVLLLVLGQDEFLSPSILTAPLDVGLLAICCAVGWLGDAVHIASLVELEVLL